jgi:hypothetical protein
METVQRAVIPEFDFHVVDAMYIVGGAASKDAGKPTGAMRITALGEGGEFQLYVRKELLAGLDPKVGDVMLARISIDGTFEPRITVRSLRPAPAVAGKGAA